MVTRIIAGSARGNPLKVPPGERTRPTTDRVREAFFSALAAWAQGMESPAEHQLAGIRLLDLYAGSGAIGLEAASRGADEVVLVDSYRPAGTTIKRNAAAIKVADRVRVQISDVRGYLAGSPQRRFDVIWADPPYALPGDELDALLVRISGGWLADDGLVVVERDARDPEPHWPDDFSERWSRRYGETKLYYARRTPPSTEEVS